MKVLHVIASLDPRSGGPAEGVRQIAREAQAWGDETTVVSLDAPGQSFLTENPFHVVPLGPAKLKYAYTPRLVSWLRAHAGNFDAVIVNGLWQYASFGTWRALHGGPVPYFVFPHGMLDPYFKRAFPLKHVKKLLYWFLAEYRTLRDARAVFFTSEEERLLARRSFGRYRCREEVTGFGTAPPPFDRSSATAEFFSAFPSLSDRRIVLFLGRIQEKKGCDLLMEAFAGFALSEPRLQLVLVGPYEETLAAHLRALAQSLGVTDRVTWTGMLEGKCKWGALYGAEVFVLSSHQENFGVAVAESLACGTPVLISDKVNIWREIAADGAGFVETDTVAGTRALLRHWFELDATGREQMRLCARECFDKRFDMRKVARTIADTISRLANGGA